MNICKRKILFAKPPLTFFEAEDKLITYEYDVVILDINLPDGNGLELLKLIKGKNPETGVLIVSAKDSLDDKLKGLDLGADDYITKPFHLAELNSRVNSLLRRRKYEGNKNIVFNEIEIDPDAKKAIANGVTLDLTKKGILSFVVFYHKQKQGFDEGGNCRTFMGRQHRYG